MEQKQLFDAFMSGADEFKPTNRLLLKTSTKNSMDFNEAYIRVHEQLNNPMYRNALGPKQNDIRNWNKQVFDKIARDRAENAQAIGGLKSVLQGDPQLSGLCNQLDNIQNDFIRNNQISNNPAALETLKRHNTEMLLIQDDEFTGSPQYRNDEILKGNQKRVELNASPTKKMRQPNEGDIRDVTVRLLMDERNQLAKYDVEKSNPLDKVKVLITPMKPENVRKEFEDLNTPLANQNIVRSAYKHNKKARTPVKSLITVEQSRLNENLGYDPNDISKSILRSINFMEEPADEKIMFANNTNPQQSSVVKTPTKVERVIVKREEAAPTPVSPMFAQDFQNVMVEKAIIQKEEYKQTVPNREERVDPTEKMDLPVDNPQVYFANSIADKFDIANRTLF